MKSILMKSKKGQLGMDVAVKFLLGLLSLVIIGVVAMIILASLGDTSIVSSNTDTQLVINNSTDAISTFFEGASTWLALLGIVILILIISAVVIVVRSFGSGARGSV